MDGRTDRQGNIDANNSLMIWENNLITNREKWSLFLKFTTKLQNNQPPYDVCVLLEISQIQT